MVWAMTRDEALATFDAAPAVEPEFMIGTWRGSELPIGHPLDGLLALSGWWGKQFVDTETVHPLLFPTRDGTALWALDPRLVPIATVLRVPCRPRRSLHGLVSALRPLAGTRTPRARLRTSRYRGVDTATRVYDHLPVNDAVRALPRAEDGADRVIGAMDLLGCAQPYFFELRRDNSLRLR